jgi:hypothetical protein
MDQLLALSLFCSTIENPQLSLLIGWAKESFLLNKGFEKQAIPFQLALVIPYPAFPIAKGLLISVLNPARSEIRPSPADPLPLKTDFLPPYDWCEGTYCTYLTWGRKEEGIKHILGID